MRKRRIAAIIVVALVAGAVGTWLALDRETVELTEDYRRLVGGTYAPLPAGNTHYILGGSPDGEAVVFLHGASIAIWDFDLQAPLLARAGYRVLRYDALGRGLSERPDVPFTRALFVRQLRELLDHLKMHRVVLVGHSLGGAVAAAFAAAYPQRVRGVVFVAPVMNAVETKGPFITCRTPVAGSLLFRLFMGPTLAARANEQWRSAGVDPVPYERLFDRQASIKGFERSMCRMFQSDLVGDYRPLYGTVDRAGIPVSFVYGPLDRTIGLQNVQDMKTRCPSFSFHRLDGTGHSPHVQDADGFNDLLMSFLRALPP